MSEVQGSVALHVFLNPVFVTVTYELPNGPVISQKGDGSDMFVVLALIYCMYIWGIQHMITFKFPIF